MPRNAGDDYGIFIISLHPNTRFHFAKASQKLLTPTFLSNASDYLVKLATTITTNQPSWLTLLTYSGGAWFEPRAGKQTILTEAFRGFTQSLRANTGMTL
jgi:hypothetical protein